ncbi:Ergosterol biosynthetic protein 28 [Zea mays]|uniref:Ergosterol biosynthetic protein 28 n=1 Tax=Zea mays TaxID=4577 RepID=A0A3L6FKT4_MAIZE|nr:Ergosterol biosynthetic protein 28 [Zea mays]
MEDLMSTHGGMANGVSTHSYFMACSPQQRRKRCDAMYQYDLGFSVTGVHGCTVAVWTLLSCTLCFLCSFNLSSKPLYMATFLSIVYAIGHLSVECVVYHTISAASLAPFTFIAVTTMVWMLLQWNSDGHNPRSGRSTSKQMTC